MARIRTVKPELFKHERLYDAEAQTGFPLRLAFIGLFTCCDREGRFKWRPRALKLDILPYDAVDFELVLKALLTAGFVRQYDVGGETYGCIPSFGLHQTINNKEASSSIPGPVDDENSTRDARVTHVTDTREDTVPIASATPLSNTQGEGKGREGERKEEGSEATASVDPPTQSAEPIPIDARTDLFRNGLAELKAMTGKTDAGCRELLGKWLKETKDDAGEVRRAIREAVTEKKASPVSWITAAVKPKAESRDWRERPEFKGVL